MVGTISTCKHNEPWSIPMLVVRNKDKILIHGSTGARALRRIAQGAAVSLVVTILDGLVISDRMFEHSANYRSAVIRGTCTTVAPEELSPMLNLFTDTIIPVRSKECPDNSEKELAQTIMLELEITDDNWIVKSRSGKPSGGEEGWVGVIPVRSNYLPPIMMNSENISESVHNLLITKNELYAQ